MKCPQCGKENPGTSRFCTSCGARFTGVAGGAGPVTPDGTQPTTAMPAAGAQPTMEMPSRESPPAGAPGPGSTRAFGVPPSPSPGTRLDAGPAPHDIGPQGPPPGAPPARGGMSRSSKAWIAVACVLGACLVAAAVTIPLVLHSSSRQGAKINSLRLLSSDGDTIDLDRVPLDKELVLVVNYNAWFKDGGSGTLRLLVTDSEGENVIDKTYDVTSSDRAQTEEHGFSMSQGSGEPLTAKAELSVRAGSQKEDAHKTLSFTVVEGKGAEVRLDEAKEAAARKVREATDALKSAAEQDVDVADLADRLSGALDELEAAKTVEEADAVAGEAQSVLDECNARVAEAKKRQGSTEQCRQNQSAIRAKLVDWWSGTGNFPDSLRELYGIPECPSGGTYTYWAPDTTPDTLHVSCSVHGEL